MWEQLSAKFTVCIASYTGGGRGLHIAYLDRWLRATGASQVSFAILDPVTADETFRRLFVE